MKSSCARDTRHRCSRLVPQLWVGLIHSIHSAGSFERFESCPRRSTTVPPTQLTFEVANCSAHQLIFTPYAHRPRCSKVALIAGTGRRELFQFLPVLSTEKASESSSEGRSFVVSSIGMENKSTLGRR